MTTILTFKEFQVLIAINKSDKLAGNQIQVAEKALADIGVKASAIQVLHIIEDLVELELLIAYSKVDVVWFVTEWGLQTLVEVGVIKSF